MDKPRYTLHSPPPDLLPTEQIMRQGANGKSAAELLAKSSYHKKLEQIPYELIIDMDDTLNANNPLFLQARRALVDVYLELDAVGADPIALAYRQQQISNELILEMGYTPERWYRASVLAAEEIAQRALNKTEHDRVLVAAEIALGVGELMAGVEQTLTLLQRAGVKTLLLTKGEKQKQEQKITAHNLRQYFSNIEIVTHKDADLLSEMIDKYQFSNPMIIGDSAHSDIAPAMKVGIRAIRIDHGDVAWQHELTDIANEVPHVSSFPEAIKLLCDEQK